MKTTLLLSFLAIFSFNYANAQCNASMTLTDNGGGNWDFTNNSNFGYLAEWWVDATVVATTWDHNHTFTQAGQYTVRLYLYDSAQVWCDSTTQIINVNTNGCYTNFTTTDNGGGNYDFTNTSAGNIGSQEWWIDGNMTYTTVNANHTFSMGSHDVCLYNYDLQANFCDSTCTTVNVNVPPCQASFWWTPDSLNQNLIWVVNNSTGNNLTYLWDFGDATTSTQAYPTHTYAGPGPYNLCLAITATNPACTDSLCQMVTLKMAPQTTAGLTINVVSALGVDSPEEAPVEVGRLYPNPVHDVAYLPLTLKRPLELRMDVLNMMGQTVYSNTSAVPAGSSKLEVPGAELAKGSYLLRITSADGDFNHTVRMMR